MPDYSAINLAQRILLSDDKKYPQKESLTINWSVDELMGYLDRMK